MPDLRMVVLGDSVPWGQGLNTPQKFYSIVQASLTGNNDSQSCIVLAHSGATIGASGSTQATDVLRNIAYRGTRRPL